MAKKILLYLVSVSLIIILLWHSGLLLKELHAEYRQDFTLLLKYYGVQWGLFVSIGILFGFCQRFIYEFKKPGSWQVDIAKIIIWGLPLGLVASSYLIFHSYNVITAEFIRYIPNYMVNIEWGPIVVAQVMLGYVIITSFYKKSN